MKRQEGSIPEKLPQTTYSSREASFEHDEESCSFSDYSSGTDSSARPMLRPPLLRKRRLIRQNRLHHRIMRCVCLGVFSALIVFILVLFRVTLIHTFIKPVGIELPLSELRQKPLAWEAFPFLNRYYGGIKTLVPRTENVPEYPGDDIRSTQDGAHAESVPTSEDNKRRQLSSSMTFDPYPNYTSPEYVARYGVKNDCFLDAARKIAVPSVRYRNGVPKGFPDAILGSNEALGIADDVCFDRFGRLGPYGLGYGQRMGGSGAGLEGDRSDIDAVWKDVPPVDFRNVKWADAQSRCLSSNKHRFSKQLLPKTDRFLAFETGSEYEKNEQTSHDALRPNATAADQLPRSAFVIRTWHDFQYTEETIMNLRSLVSELSLISGGEYTVYFLIHVRDDNLRIWADDAVHDQVLRDALPKEFSGMGILWSERQMGLIYSGLEESFTRNLPVHGVYRSAFMALQYFAHQHPEYEFFWNWEVDIRNTGHWYHLLEKISQWSKKQPRKGLWERNSRFYVPSVHGSWEDFRQMVRVQTELGSMIQHIVWAGLGKKPPKTHLPGEPQTTKSIWGPERGMAEQDVLTVEGEGIPPTTYEQDKYEWGVGEEADLIVLNPLFDPDGTTWLLKDDVTGYSEKHGHPPRRASIITASRLSRKLLKTMHRETSEKRHTMFTEMWPATTCLHHGFKAVYAPHSVYIDRRWPPSYLETVFNGGKNHASGGARTSIFGDREHNFKGTTWFYSADHAMNLWNRWLGYKVNNDGGEAHELAHEGRMCLPPMLLHPVKEVSMIIQKSDETLITR